MSIDIQVLSSTLLNFIQAQMQDSFNTTCLPSFGSNYVDHVDVTGATAAIVPAGAEFTLPVDVYAVDMAMLQASVNGTPTGATSPKGSASIVLTLSITGTTLTLACTDVTFNKALSSWFGSAAGLVALEIKAQIGTVGSADLSPIFSSLGLPLPTTSGIAQSGTSLFIQFDASGSPIDNLQTGQDWCLFVDSTTMQNVASASVDSALSTVSLITSHTTSATWAPSGTVPQVNVAVAGKVTVPDPLDGSFYMNLSIDFSLQPLIPFPDTELLETVTWSWDAQTGYGPANVDEVQKVAAVLNPASFGGTQIGPNQVNLLVTPPLAYGAFSLSQSLPTLSLSGAIFEYGSVVGLTTGMVLGGAVTGIPTADTKIVTFEVYPFAEDFAFFEYCQGGSGNPTLDNVIAEASATYSDAGKLCAVSFLSPSNSVGAHPKLDLSLYLGLSPPSGTVTVTGNISFWFDGLVSLAVNSTGQPIEILVQTTRGVRIISFGMAPKPEVDSHGDVTNLSRIEVDNCPSAVDPWYQVFHAYNPLWSVDPPESWVDSLDQVAMFESSIITVGDLPAGELVTFNQPVDGGLTIVSAALDGLAIVPALLAVRSFNEQAAMMRANRSTLGELLISATLFQRVVSLQTPGAVSHQLTGDSNQAEVTTRFADGSAQTVLINGLGVSLLAGNQAGVSLPSTKRNLATTGTSTVAATASSWSIDIPGLVKILSVPGFERAPLAVAKLSDGTHLVLSRNSNGAVRVAGFVPRWPDMPPVSGNWAISSAAGDRIAVFRVRRIASSKCSCE